MPPPADTATADPSSAELPLMVVLMIVTRAELIVDA